MDSMNGTVLPPWESAVKAASGDLGYYPLSHCEGELQTLIGHLTPADVGTSLLLLGPSLPLQMAAVKRASQGLFDEETSLYVHGMIASDVTSLLRIFSAFLAPDRPVFSTFDDLTRGITEYCGTTSKRLLVVLQSFERFAMTSQHFLYTLFELTASQPIWVLGMTSRCDVLDLLEKRVKSRFSQTILYLTHPRTWEAYQGTLEVSLRQRGKWDQAEILATWRRYDRSITKVMSNDTILLTLERLFEQDHDPVNALTLVFLDGLLQCTSRSPELRLTRIRIAANNNFNQDVLPALSLAEQCALVACKRVADKCPGEPVTFDALFDEYALGFGTSAKVHDGALLGARFSRSVMRTAVDGLLAKGILYRGDPDNLRAGISSMTVDTREEIHCRWPLSTLPNLMLRPDGSGASDSLRKLASEIL